MKLENFVVHLALHPLMTGFYLVAVHLLGLGVEAVVIVHRFGLQLNGGILRSLTVI